MGIVTFGVHSLLALVIGGRFIPAVLSILVAMAVYIVAVLRLGTLSEEDIKDLPMGVRLLKYCKKLHLLPEAKAEAE